MNVRRFAVASAAAAVLATASYSKAALLAYDPFGYNSGADITTASNTDTGSGSSFTTQYWTTNPTFTNGTDTVTGSSLTYPGGEPTSGGAVQITPTVSTGIAYRKVLSATTPADGSGQSLYISMLVQLSSAAEASGTTLMEPLNSGNNGFANFGYNEPSGKGAYWGWNPNAAGWTVGTAAISTTPTLIVEELDFKGSSDTEELYINPDVNNPVADLSASFSLGSDQVLSLQPYVGGGTGTDTVTLDEFRVGTTLLDVVPEPASIGLLGAAVGFAALRRRRRAATI